VSAIVVRNVTDLEIKDP